MMALKEENGPSQAATARDYVDKADGTGLFSTTKVKDLQWWSNEKEDEDSVYALTYLAEYRGFIKWLVHNHIPFDIIVRPDAAELSRYQTVMVPSLVSVSDNNANLLRDYVFGGGNLIITKTGNA
jgi:beta-galactosidase GanA